MTALTPTQKNANIAPMRKQSCLPAGFICRLVTGLVCAGVSWGMEPSIEWSCTVTGGREAVFNGMCEADDGGFMVVGEASGGDASAVIACRISSYGNVLWEQNYLMGTSAAAGGVVRIPGGFIIAGTCGQGEESDGFLMRIDDLGDIVWRSRFGGEGTDGFNHVSLTEGGDVLAVGFETGSEGHRNAWMVCIDQNGTVLWSREHEDLGHQVANGADVIPGTGFVLAGSDGSDAFLLFTDSTGNWIGKTLFDDDGVEMARGVRTLRDGGFLLWGTSRVGEDLPSALFVSYDEQGNRTWNMTWTTGGVESCWSAVPMESGGYTFLCNSNSPGRLGFRSILLRLDPWGETIWQKEIDLGRQTELRVMMPTPDGGFVLAGRVQQECLSRMPVVVNLSPEDLLDW